jgi:hypothetical protein
MSQCCPHFYCDRCSNAIIREADKKASWGAPGSSELVERIAATLPACPCGGHFRAGANPKCPACKTQFAHPGDVVQRLSDPQVILIHSACLFSDQAPPYRVEIDEPKIAS